MAEKRNLNFEINSAKDLNKMLTGLLMDVRRGEVNVEAANTIAKIADKVNKNNVNILEYKKITKHNKEIEFFEGADSKEAQVVEIKLENLFVTQAEPNGLYHIFDKTDGNRSLCRTRMMISVNPDLSSPVEGDEIWKKGQDCKTCFKKAELKIEA